MTSSDLTADLSPHPDISPELPDQGGNAQDSHRPPSRPVSQAPRARLTRKAGLTAALALFATLGAAGAWYGLGGYWKDSAPVVTALQTSIKSKDRTAFRSLLSAAASADLTREELDALLENLPNYTDPALTVTIEKPEGAAQYVARTHRVLFTYDAKKGQQPKAVFLPIALTLEQGTWRVGIADLLKTAHTVNVLAIKDAQTRLSKVSSLTRPEINQAKSASERDYKDLTAFAAMAQDADESFNANSDLTAAKTDMAKIQDRLTWFTRVNATEDLFVKADALIGGDDIAGAMTLYRDILQSTAATTDQKDRARRLLSTAGAADVVLKVDQANDLYERAEYAQAISLLQGVVDSDDASDDVKGRAYYLMSFAFRDYTDAPNNHQKAIDAARSSTTLDASNGVYWCHLGDVLRQYKNHDAANDAFNRGIQEAYLDDEKANCYVWQGANEMEAGNYAIAHYLWETALSLNPQNPDARRFLGDSSSDW